MAHKSTEEWRNAWRKTVDLDAPLAGQLHGTFIRAWQVAYIMGCSESAVYDAARRNGDDAAASREVPCTILGGYHFPTAAFISWFERAGAPSEPQAEPSEIATAPTERPAAHIELTDDGELVATVRLVLDAEVLKALAEVLSRGSEIR